MITIWAIHHFNIPLPDLQDEDYPSAGKVYYYYGRWLRITPHDKETAQWIRQFLSNNNILLLDVPDDHLRVIGRLEEKIRLQNTIANRICPTCVLSQLGLPCRKFYLGNSRSTDLCLTHRFQLVKPYNPNNP